MCVCCTVWEGGGGGGYIERLLCLRQGGCTDKASCLLNLLSRLLSSRRCPHAANEAKRMLPVENLTLHGVMAATTPDKH